MVASRGGFAKGLLWGRLVNAPSGGFGACFRSLISCFKNVVFLEILVSVSHEEILRQKRCHVGNDVLGLSGSCGDMRVVIFILIAVA